MASSSKGHAPGAPTPGILDLASSADLRVGQWNMGLPSENHFSKDGKIHELLSKAATWIKLMADYVHVVALNELHPAFQGELDKKLRDVSSRVRMVGLKSGDALVWCHTQQ